MRDSDRDSITGSWRRASPEHRLIFCLSIIFWILEIYYSLGSPVFLMLGTMGLLGTILFGLREKKADIGMVSLGLSSEETLDSHTGIVEDQRLSSYALSPTSTRTMPNAWRPEVPGSSRYGRQSSH